MLRKMWNYRWQGMVPALLVAGMVVWGGCSGQDGNAQAVVSPGVTESATAVDPPSQEAIVARLGLNESQAEAMSALLAEFQKGMEERRQERGQRGQRGEGAGPPQGVGPMHGFLQGSADILEPEQMLGLVGILKEWQEERREEMQARFEGQGQGQGFNGPGRGRGGRGGQGQGQGLGQGQGKGQGGLWADLDLSTEQREQLAEARAVYHQTVSELRESLREGTLSAEAYRDAAKEARLQHEAAVEAVVGAEAYAAMQEQRAERREERHENREDRMNERSGMRLVFLTEVLGLSESQQTAVQAILDEAHAAMQALHEKAGELSPEDMFYERTLIREASREAMAGVLTAEQLELWEGLEDLRGGGGGHGQGLGHGHGPGGPGN